MVAAGNHEQQDENGKTTYVVSALGKAQRARLLAKIKRSEDYNAFQQSKITRSRLPGERARKHTGETPIVPWRAARPVIAAKKPRQRRSPACRGSPTSRVVSARACAKDDQGKTLGHDRGYARQRALEAEKPDNRAKPTIKTTSTASIHLPLGDLFKSWKKSVPKKM